MTNWIVIGIGGATCSGKTTLAKKLHEKFKNSVLINQDTYFRPKDDPRHVHIPELNHHNWDILESLDMNKMHSDILGILSSGEDDNNQGETKLLIMDGFLLFNYKPIFDLCDMRYFLDLSREECEWRRNRRVYDPPDVPRYFDMVVWPEYVRYKKEIEDDEEVLRGITFLDGTVDNDQTFQRVFREISQKF
ncbi:nicotinamide riboside kinase 1 isoform X2 [Diachasma alloeum]|uniref:nicotinamide riboside kinase 1 isoform X2 n=1 Tax=Diachasma alloeum TaxID=454923 RepID=UPI0007382FEB|nr:nicotinamide riboside kinase 1 isoform X2 [Diachasma alloeum]